MSRTATRQFVIDDERHCERFGDFHSFEDARLAILGFLSMPWDQQPNRAPCTNWKKCGRTYCIIEYIVDATPYTFFESTTIAKIDCDGSIWLYEKPDVQS